MKQVFMLGTALCILITSCKKDKHSDYYKAVVLQGGNHCEKGTWIRFDQQLPISPSSSNYSSTFYALNLPANDNVPGKSIYVKFTYDTSGTICPTLWQISPDIVLTDIK